MGGIIDKEEIIDYTPDACYFYLKKDYGSPAGLLPVLKGVHFTLNRNEMVFMIGRSGSGKSTLLHLMGGLDQPTSGKMIFEGEEVTSMNERHLARIRNRRIGLVFQFYHLLPELTTLENILAPAFIAESTFGYWMRRGAYRRRAFELLELVGLGHRAKHKPRELSGGEMQRAAIARALLLKPKVLLADEPTGNLDRSTGESVMQTLAELNDREKLTIVMVTHDPWIAGQADRTVKLVEGRIAVG